MNYEKSDGLVPYEDQAEDYPMSWTIPKHSKGAVRRAGKRLIAPRNNEEYLDSLDVLNNWRAAHACPLNSIQTSLRYRATQVSEDAIISQRLKRAQSIKGKLQRFRGMQLHTMQDIGGCRATLQSIQEVYELKALLESNPLKSELVHETDYIRVPKPSGYRGIHRIYKYRSTRPSPHDGLFIEVQIRSIIQHAWATSVEIAGTFLGESLKSGEGTPEWLEFFNLVGSLFATLEGYGPVEINEQKFQKIKDRVNELNEELSITEKLKAFSVMTQHTNYIVAEKGYFLLTLKIDERSIDVKYYPKGTLAYATEDYGKLEEEYKNENTNIVLVAVESVSALKKSYPNYFADSGIFLGTLETALKQ